MLFEGFFITDAGRVPESGELLLDRIIDLLLYPLKPLIDQQMFDAIGPNYLFYVYLGLNSLLWGAGLFGIYAILKWVKRKLMPHRSNPVKSK